MPSPGPSGVIFDFDGVVVDSLAVHLIAWQEAFQQLYGVSLDDTEGLPGRSTMAIAEILAHRIQKPQTKVQLAELKKELLSQNRHKIEFLPGAKDCFEWLKAHKVPFGIASNAPRAFISSTLSALHYDVEIKFGSDDVAQPKPEPDVFLKCAKALNISVTQHANVIVFEDSPHGVKAAVKAGMFPIGILTQNSAEDMRIAGAKTSCRNLSEAIGNGWLENLPM